MAKNAENAVNGELQGSIVKKCSTERHSPESNKACAGGTCQHTCAPEEIAGCRHKWTVIYWVQGRQREKSFSDELDERKRVVQGSGLKKARDFQLEHTRGKRAQGKTYTDPKEADELFTVAARGFILHSARLKAGATARRNYVSLLDNDIRRAFGGRTLAQMATAAAADEVSTFLNVTIAHRSTGHRRTARMIIVWTMDAAVNADKIGRHKLTGITLGKGTAVTKRQQRAEEDDGEAGSGFVFITDAQVRTLAEGGAFPPDPDGRSRRPRVLAGTGLAAWLQRTMGVRICEALGAEKKDFRTRKDGSRYMRLRSQASRDGQSRVPLKHRARGEGRDVPVPDFVWDMVAAMPDGPLCPGVTSRYLRYHTVRDRFAKLTKAMGIQGCTTHSLRHQFATEAIDQGQNIANVSQALGHVSVETTLRVYVHATADAEDRMRQAMNDRWSIRPAAAAA